MEPLLPAPGWTALGVALGAGVGVIVSVLGAVVWSIARALGVEMLGADPTAGNRRDD